MSKSRREKAKAAQEEAMKAEKARDRKIKILGGGGVLLLVAGIIGIAAFAGNNSPTTSTGLVNARPDDSASLPAQVLPAGHPQEFGIQYNEAPNAPIMEIWEDFQCPSCGALETEMGATFVSLADAGQIQLVWRPIAFLDQNLGNDASKRATSALGCALDQGKGKEYHDLIYANQPQTQGVGWNDIDLLAYGKEVGMDDTQYAEFEQCVNDRTYVTWAANSTEVFRTSSYQGTPTVVLDGKVLPFETLYDVEALQQEISQANQQ